MGRKRTVCIVGAGAAGLVTLKNFLTREDQFEIVCYEQTKLVGGTWNYVEATGKDENGLPIHSSMYKHLRTNLPRQVMEYPDFELKLEESFMQHEVFLQYLNDYCEHFQLRDNIQFETVVRKIALNDDGHTWTVTIQSFPGAVVEQKHFDFVILCHGHYSTPLYNDCNGIDKFTGEIVHSHDYRTADRFKNQKILVIGAGISGMDIALELSEVSDHVFLLDRKEKPFFEQVGNVKLINGTLVTFNQRNAEIKLMKSDQTKVMDNIDTVFVCTGYKMDFDLLDSSCGITVNPDNTVNGFYRHTVNIRHPSMACIGMNALIPPCKMFHTQSLYYLNYLLGKFELPSAEEMEHRNEEEIRRKLELGQRPKDRHKVHVEMIEQQFRDLEAEAGLGMIVKPVTIGIYRDIQKSLIAKPLGFKYDKYRVLDDHTFVKDQN